MFPLSLFGTILHGLVLLLLTPFLLGHNWNKKFMNTFILVTLSLDDHILLASSKNIMSMPPNTLGDLEILGISAST
jgi:hypothetical protein